MRYNFTIYKYLVPTLHENELVCLLIPTLFSEPREGFLNEREMITLRDLGSRISKIKDKNGDKVIVNLNILVPYDLGEEDVYSLERDYDIGGWLECNFKDDKWLFEEVGGQIESLWGALIDGIYKSQMHKLVWHYIKSLTIFNPAFFPTMYGISNLYLAKRVLKGENLRHINEEFVVGLKALVEGDPRIELKMNIQSSECLKGIRKLIEEGIKSGKSPKLIKKEVNDFLVSLIGYGEYGAEVYVPDAVYEFYRNEAVRETLGRERNPIYLWKIKKVKRNE